ncbi:MAG TPA: metallohydrolase, partial [Thermoanaerobaculia bacterium]|nr:metallohydrolase [Thermoanaerobaculia bacterium]
GVNSLHAFAAGAMRGLMAGGQALGPEVELLASMYGVSNDAADRLLMETLPADNGIEPRYVHAGMEHGLDLPPDTEIHILAPEKDVDHFYLGEELDASLKSLQGLTASLAPAPPAAAAAAAPARPANISATDFRVLQSRMLSNGLAFAAKESSIQNNLSVVLLIEWKKRRLLFVGDAEWEGEFREGKHNGSWNVMWEKHRTGHLKAPVDFLKIGHHGSINATPPPAETRPEKAPADGIYAVLDTILPVPADGARPTAQAIVSTEREFYNPIPECKRLVDLARRVSNTSVYGERLAEKGIDPASIWATTKAKKNQFFEKYEKEFLEQPQPMRTDLELVIDGRDFVEVEIPP